jgi:hypothetical protein
MNGAQRRVVNTIIDGLGQINVQMSGYADQLQYVIDELQEKYDDMSEKAQEGDKGEELLMTIETLESVHGDLENGQVDSACYTLQNI